MTLFAATFAVAVAATDLRARDDGSIGAGGGMTAEVAWGVLVVGMEAVAPLAAGMTLPALSRLVGGTGAAAITIAGLLIAAFGTTTALAPFAFVFGRFFTSSNSPAPKTGADSRE